MAIAQMRYSAKQNLKSEINKRKDYRKIIFGSPLK
jgi:hypothetical protein